MLPGLSETDVIGLTPAQLAVYWDRCARYVPTAPQDSVYQIRVGSKFLRDGDTHELRRKFVFHVAKLRRDAKRKATKN